MAETVGRDPEIAAVAHRAIGMAEREDHRLGEAIRHLALSVRIAASHHLEIEAARSRVQLAPALAFRGEGSRALEEIDIAEDARCPARTSAC